jgi:hypothetical protein
LVNADDVNKLGRSLHTTRKNAEALLVASKEIGLEVIADKTKYKVIYRDQQARRSHSIKTDYNSFERAKEFKYFETTLTIVNYIQKEIKSRLK